MNIVNILKKIPYIESLKKKLLVTFFILLIYRIGAHIPTPGVDTVALSEFFKSASGTILSFVNMFSGGALSKLTVFALGVMPFISASIIMQLLTASFPSLEKLAKEEGEYGRRKIMQYTRYLTLVIAILQSLGIAIGLEKMHSPSGIPIVPNPGIGFIITTVLTLTAGTMFLLWLGEKITSKGIGNGISLIIMAGILSSLPGALINLITFLKTGQMEINKFVILCLVVIFMIISVIVVELAEYKVPIRQTKRLISKTLMVSSNKNYLPLKLNPANVIPIIFAASVLMFPATIARFIQHPWAVKLSEILSPQNYWYYLIYAALIFIFTYYYTAVIFNPKELAENLNKMGMYIPGVRAGKETEKYLAKIVNKLTFIGAVFLTVIAIVPLLITQKLGIPFYVGGTAVLIVVGVGLDLLRRLEAAALEFSYESFLKKPKLIQKLKKIGYK